MPAEHAGEGMEQIQQHNKEAALEKAEEGAACILQAGCLLMSSGAEVYRVEETMTRMGYSIPGVQYCTSYVTVTGIFCSVVVDGQTVTRMARIRSQNRNLSMVAAVNTLSRQAEQEHFSARTLWKKLMAIEKIPDYSDGVKTLWGAIGAAGFVIFFGGGLQELGFVFLIGLVVRYGSVLLGRFRINEFFVNMFLSFVAAMLSVLFHKIDPQASVSIMIISSIMLLVPGLMITNALRDSVMGEPLSALVLLMQALLVAGAIAVGVLLGLSLFGVNI